MKKIVLILSVFIVLASCSTGTSNNVKVNNVQEQKVESNVNNNQNDVVELSPDEEKIVEDLLNF